MRRPALILAIGMVLGALAVIGGLLLGAWLAGPTDESLAPAVDRRPTCQEDMACWDCETMGNRVCGPMKDEGRRVR